MAETPLLDPDAEAAWGLFILGADDPPPATRDDAEDAAWFRAQLEELGFTQGTFARWMLRRGDKRSKRNVLRSIQRMCAGHARVSGEMRVLLGLLLRSKQRSVARRAKARDEREAPWNDLSEAHGEGGSDSRAARQAGDEESGEREAPTDDLSEDRGERGQDRKEVRW